MADLLPKSNLTSGATTESDFQSGIGALYDFLSQLVVGVTPEALEIASGVVIPLFSTFMIVDSEAATGPDELDRILNTNIGVKVIIVKAQSASRPITLRNNISGSGKFRLAKNVNAVLDDPSKLISFYYDNLENQWVELYRNWGVFTANSADSAAARTALGLGTAAALNAGTNPENVAQISTLGALAFMSLITSSTVFQDLVITGAKLANSTIPIGKMANGPANTLMGWNESGVATSVTGIPAGGAMGFLFVPAGWIKADGKTVGSETSGATGLAALEAYPVFKYMWENTSNFLYPIQNQDGTAGTRGLTALADFQANKRIPLLDLRGEGIRGHDDGRGVDITGINGVVTVGSATINVSSFRNQNIYPGMRMMNNAYFTTGTTVISVTSTTVVMSSNATGAFNGLLGFVNRPVGSSEMSDMLSHDHMTGNTGTYNAGFSGNGKGPIYLGGVFNVDYIKGTADTNQYNTGSTSFEGGFETRNRNVSLILCMKL